MSRLRRTRAALQDFISEEAAGGVALLAMTAVGVMWANFDGAGYRHLWESTITLGGGSLRVSERAREWVNEALMTLFFFVVGLELKRELVIGELRDRRAAALPIFAAAGGMIVPASIFFAFNAGTPAARAWGVPVATDIAFVLGALAMLGRRAPAGLKLFLLALAIVDDLGGIVVIALFYSDGVSIGYLIAAGMVAVVIAAMRRRVAAIPAYMMVGVVLWYLVYRSGVHATMAGVMLGMITPAVPVRGREVLRLLEQRLVRWSAFVAVPVFALANAGVELSASEIRRAVESRVVWGVVLGLVVGKAVGITAFALGAVRLGWARLPVGLRPLDMAGGAALGGIGFTVALFIADLSFGYDPAVLAQVKIGILVASITAAVVGSVVLAASRDDPAEAGGDHDAPSVAGDSLEAEGGSDIAAGGG